MYKQYKYFIVRKEITLFKNEIANKQFTYKWYMYNLLTVFKQMTDVRLNC